MSTIVKCKACIAAGERKKGHRVGEVCPTKQKASLNSSRNIMALKESLRSPTTPDGELTLPQDMSEDELEAYGIELNLRQIDLLAERGYTFDEARAVGELETVQLDAKETSKHLQNTLSNMHPDTVFSKASERGNVTIRWKGGPTVAQVKDTTSDFVSGGFDGMTDSNYFLPASVMFTKKGPVPVKYSAHFLSESRYPDLSNVRALIADVGEPNMTHESNGAYLYCVGCGGNLKEGAKVHYYASERGGGDIACSKACAALTLESRGQQPKNPETPLPSSNIRSMKALKGEVTEIGRKIIMENTFSANQTNGRPTGTVYSGEIVAKNSTGYRVLWEGNSRPTTIEYPKGYLTEFVGEGDSYRETRGESEYAYTLFD